MLYKIQQLTIDRVMYAPVMDFSALMGIGPRVTNLTSPIQPVENT